MRLFSSALLLLVAVLVRESSCAVWGSKDSRNGVRGRGQRSPELFELADDLKSSLDEGELQSVAARFTAKGPSLKRTRRQTDDNIGYKARLANDSHLQAVVHWTGHPSEYLFIVTRKVINGHSDESWLWRSVDYGKNFTNETFKLEEQSPEGVDPVIEWYYISPLSQYLIFADIKHNDLYITLDEGNTYNRYDCPFTPDDIQFQSIRAPNSDNSVYSRYVLGYDNTAKTLWVSINLGEEWHKIGDNVPADRYYWRRLDEDVEGDLGTVYFEQSVDVNGNTSMLYYWNSSVGTTQRGQLFSQDLGTFKTGSFVLEFEYMFVQKPETASVTTKLGPLWVSWNRSPTFAQSGFPVVSERQHYAVVDASEGQVFIAVYHVGNISNLYISEERGINYTLSLQDIVGPPEEEWVDGNPTIDVHVVEGVVGTYFANIHAADTDVGSTVVTYDKGGRWNQLFPPALDSTGQPIICVPPYCSLHLHMDIDQQDRQYQSILSQDSAIGLIMAQGNLGSTLTSSLSSTRLYFSRDGGFTWAEVRSGRWEFQFAGLGSIVVAVQKRRLINTVLYSCDEGASWNTASFVSSEYPLGIVVIGMRTEAEEKSLHVTVFGYDIFGGFEEWLIFDLDFSTVVPNQCDEDTDYYDWIPTDERPGSRCLLGEVVAYERRNTSGECCFVDPTYEKGQDRNACDCAIEDFECDFGFERDNLNSPCNPFPGFIYPPDPPDDCPEGENYTYSSGYRKIAGDRCVPGKETYFFPITRACPIKPPRYLVLDYSPRQLQPGAAAAFTLTQFEGARISTKYTWDFNDSTPLLYATGFTSARAQVHTFSKPGVYVVNVTASNEGGSAEALLTVTVFDVVATVQITPPSQVYEGQAPTSISLLFGVNVTTVFNTDPALNLAAITKYSWSFGDGATDNTVVPAGSHTFLNASDYTVGVTVHAAFFVDSAEATFSLTVYEATSVVDVIPNSSEITVKDDSNFVPTDIEVAFSANTDSIIIPPDTVYTWHVVKTGPGGANSFEQTERLAYTFTQWGQYHVSVVGQSQLTGASFVGQVYITAEYLITDVSSTHKPSARIDTPVQFDFSFASSATTQYTGPLTLSIFLNDTEIVSVSAGDTDNLATTLFIEVNTQGAIEYTLKAFNDVSHTEKKTTVNVVGPGEYAELSIQFVNPPPQYNDTAWQEKLKTSVRESIVVLDAKLKDLVEILNVRTGEGNRTNTDQNKNVLKRDATEKVVYVYVDVIILPADYNAESFEEAFLFAHVVVTQAKNGSLAIEVDGQTLTISSANAGGSGVIIEPPIIIERFNTQKYAIIGGVLGAIVLLTVVITTVLILIVYFYRRKYTRLHVRYSRLQQTPVRFTFTPGGEMVEDDFEDEEDDEEFGDMGMKPT